jgi:hypothetical protein
MMSGDLWLDKAREEVSPELIEDPVHRALFDAFLTQPGATRQLPSGLSDEGGRRWSELREAAERLAGQEVSGIFDRATQILKARPQYRQYARTSDPGEKTRLRAALRERFPEADSWYEYQKQRRTRGYKGA